MKVFLIAGKGGYEQPVKILEKYGFDFHQLRAGFHIGKFTPVFKQIEVEFQTTSREFVLKELHAILKDFETANLNIAVSTAHIEDDMALSFIIT